MNSIVGIGSLFLKTHQIVISVPTKKKLYVNKVNLSKKTRLPARESRKAEEEEWMKKMEEGKLREGKEREEKEVDKTEILTFKQFNQKAVNFIQCGDLRSDK